MGGIKVVTRRIKGGVLGAPHQSDSLHPCHIRDQPTTAASIMKLVTVLMLVALPLYCYAGSGCQLLEDVVEKTLDPELSTTEYVEALQEFISDDAAREVAAQFKQCFLIQSNETLSNFGKMMETMYNSLYCALF
uniref:Secretoglobin family 2A member 2 n=2 Tax=Equus TaxID=9789 RepID=F6WF42_HORSE|nr:mammaglobin-B-like isoform X2 [Equus caballus]